MADAIKTSKGTEGVDALIAHLKSTGTPQVILDVIAKARESVTINTVIGGIQHAVQWTEKQLHPVGYAGTIKKAQAFAADALAAKDEVEKPVDPVPPAKK